MNQRFEDTYVKATDAICGMAKDYRLLEERHRLLVHRCEVEQDIADDLRGKVSELLAEAAAPIDCENCPHQHPEYREAQFSLSSPRTIEHEESDIDLAVEPGHFNEWVKKNHSAPEAPILYGNFFDVIMWRWVFNTVGHSISRW